MHRRSRQGASLVGGAKPWEKDLNPSQSIRKASLIARVKADYQG